MLGLHVFRQTEPPLRVDRLASPPEDGSIPLSALPKDTTSKLVGLFPYVLNAKQESCEYHIKSLGITRLWE